MFFRIFFTLFTINASFCQITSLNYNIEYNFKFKDINNEWSTSEKYLLIGNSLESFYINYNKFRNDSIVFQNLGERDNSLSKEVRQNFLNNSLKLPKYNVNQDLRVWKKIITQEIHTIRQEGYFMVSKEVLNPVWEITGEKKNINGMTCIKAIIQYGGRNFIAYFNPDIPINDGPYKFYNLPGLIIQVKDDKEMFELEFIRLNEPKPVYVNKKSMIPNQNFYITRIEMASMLKKNIENPQNYMLFKLDELTTQRYIARMKKRMDLLIEIE